MTKLIEFETERLLLRQWHETDRAPFASLNADPRVMEFFPSLLERIESDVIADRIQSKITERGWGWWAVELKASKEFIGFVGLNVPAPELPVSPCVEIGWRLGFPYWGKGYAVEAASNALGVGFDLLKLPEIIAFTAIRNVRSRSVMTKLGMQEAAAGFDHPHVPEGNPLRRHCVYRLTRDQWQMRAR